MPHARGHFRASSLTRFVEALDQSPNGVSDGNGDDDDDALEESFQRKPKVPRLVAFHALCSSLPRSRWQPPWRCWIAWSCDV